ncbi:MAG: hypothetical protein GKR89_36500 [Candidatus Latescibacteria bacterium]|nr:hypothetical protein [Candidatus Latescibacterota bacterium]
MDGLLIALFVLFSIFSAIAERRKRKKQAEEAEVRRQERAAQEGQTESRQVEEGEKEEWPFPMPGGDPFETQPQRRAQIEDEEEEEDEETAQAREIQRLAQAAQQATLQEEWHARQLKRRLAMEEAGEQPSRPAGKRRSRRWKLDAQSARRAVVYAEIIGRPKAERLREGPPGA